MQNSNGNKRVVYNTVQVTDSRKAVMENEATYYKKLNPYV